MLFFNTELPTEQCTHSALVLFWVFDSTYLLCEDYYFLLLNCSVFNMTPPPEVIGFCLKKTWKYDCAMCPSVFSTWGHNQLHNLQHFNRCTMCKLTLWSRDRLLKHLRVDLGKTRVKEQNVNCRTQNLPVPTTPKSVSNNPSTLDIPTLPIFRRCRQCIMYGVTTSQKDLQFCSVPPQGWSQSTLALQQCHCYHPCVWVKEFPAQGSS